MLRRSLLVSLLCSVTLLSSLGPASVRADLYDLRDDGLKYAYPSIRRVIGMYSLEDSPTFLSQDKVYPYIQLNLKFTAHAAAAKKAADTGDDKQSGTAPQASKAVTLAAPSHSRLFRAMADAAPSGGSPDAAPSGGSPAVTRAHVGTADPRIQVLVLAATTLDSLGHPVAGDKMLRDFCCTETLFQQHIDGCDEVGSLIIKGDSANYKVMDAFFRPAHPMSAELVGLDGRFDVKTTSEHILIIANCDSRLSEYVTEVSGMGEWMNPYGYLPGRLFGFLPFYFGMVIVYAALTTLWALLCLLHRKEIAGIQHIISSALVLTLIEVVCWFMDYNSFNKSGERDMSGVIAAIVFTVLRLTISRMLVVAVSIGFPVVRPNLAVGTQVKIGLLGFIYFLSEASLEVVTRYSQTNETAEHWRLFLSLPVAVLNAIFYWWIFTALHDLLAYLEQQNQVIKLQMYKTFTNMLAGSLFAAVVFALYQIYFMATDQLALHWSLLWLLDGGFQLLLYTVIFVCMAWLWRPSSDSRRYAYAELSLAGGGGGAMQIGGLDDEDEFHSGEVEMSAADTHAGNGSKDTQEQQAPITQDNAKFTVEEDEDEEAARALDQKA